MTSRKDTVLDILKIKKYFIYLTFQKYLESINSFHFLCVVRMYYILFHNFLSNNLF